MLRLGHGEELLETEKDFSRQGRVNHMLKRRLELLVKVEELGKTLASIIGKPARSRNGTLANSTRVACVRSDTYPPPVWQLWVPSFCSLAFVREMRLR